MKIRRIEAKDFRSIYVLNQELGYEYPAEEVKKRIEHILENTKDIILVAELYNETEIHDEAEVPNELELHNGSKRHNEVVGYIHGSPYELLFSDSMMNLLGFVVSVENRNSGIGKKLIEALEDYAKANGFSGIRLVSGSDRTEAHRFYEKHGYIFRKNQKNFVKVFR